MHTEISPCVWITVLQCHEDVMLNAYEYWKLSELRSLGDKTLEQKPAGKKKREKQLTNQTNKKTKKTLTSFSVVVKIK